MNGPSPTGRPPSKATLFCPTCDHAAPAGGDWLYRDRPRGEAVVCPECGTVLTVRRSRDPIPA